MEIASQTINRFKINNPEFNDGRSTIVNGSSFDINNVAKVPKEIDFLFIDGAHEYEAVRRDFSNYFKSVKKNGIIAFHDTKNEKYGVHKFTRELKNGHLGLQVDIKDIWFSEEVGISYFKV